MKRILALAAAALMGAVLLAGCSSKKAEYVVLDEGLSNEVYAIGFRKEDQTLRDAVQKALVELVRYPAALHPVLDGSGAESGQLGDLGEQQPAGGNRENWIQHGEQRIHRTLALFGRKRGDPMVQLLVKQLRAGTQIRLGDELVTIQ